MPDAFRTAVVGPGPHVIRHDLGAGWYMINVYDDQLNARFFSATYEPNEATVTIGYLSTEHGWIPGCDPNEVVHILIHL